MKIPLVTRSRFELIGTITCPNTNAVYNLPTQGGLLPMDRFIHSLLLRVRLRITMPSSNAPSAVFADAPYSLINRVVISGRHRLRNQQEEFFNLRGPEIYQLARVYSGIAPYSVPATLSIDANATNDVDFYLPIPFTPLRVHGSVQDDYALDAPNYDNLKLDIYWADPANLFALSTGSVSFSAYGSSSGYPEIRVYGRFYQAGASLFRGFVPGRVWRTYTEVTGSPMTTTATGTRLANVPKGHRLRGVMIKTGIRATTVTAGNDAYSSLSDVRISNIAFMRGLNRQIRFYRDLIDMRQEVAERYSILLPTGYGLIDFAQFGQREEVLDLRGLVSGPTGDTDVYIQADVSGTSNAGAVFVWEEWRHQPQVVKL